jgi:hypothetical protein
MKRLLHPLLAVTMVLSGTAALTAATASPAAALCTASPLQGDWRNTNSNTNAITRVVVETCQPVTRCSGDICTTQHDAGTFMTPYGKCHPTDCNWGRKQVQYMADGWIRAIYDFGFKTSHVWAKTYDYWGTTYLRVWVNNDFAWWDGRSDYTTDEWFLR